MPKSKREDVILEAISTLSRDVASTNVRLDHTNDRLNSMDKTLTKQEINLEVHVKRSDMNEQLVKQHKVELEGKIADMKKEVKPALRHVAMVEGMMKGVGFLAMLSGMGEGIIKLIQFFHH